MAVRRNDCYHEYGTKPVQELLCRRQSRSKYPCRSCCVRNCAVTLSSAVEQQLRRTAREPGFSRSGFRCRRHGIASILDWIAPRLASRCRGDLIGRRVLASRRSCGTHSALSSRMYGTTCSSVSTWPTDPFRARWECPVQFHHLPTSGPRRTGLAWLIWSCSIQRIRVRPHCRPSNTIISAFRRSRFRPSRRNCQALWPQQVSWTWQSCRGNCENSPERMPISSCRPRTLHRQVPGIPVPTVLSRFPRTRRVRSETSFRPANWEFTCRIVVSTTALG